MLALECLVAVVQWTRPEVPVAFEIPLFAAMADGMGWWNGELGMGMGMGPMGMGRDGPATTATIATAAVDGHRLNRRHTASDYWLDLRRVTVTKTI